MATSISLAVTKLNHLSYSPAVTMDFVPDDILGITTKADLSSVIQYFNTQKSKLDSVETTTNVNTIYAAMTNPQMVAIEGIDATTFSPVKTFVVNKNNYLISTGSAAGYAITGASVLNKTFTVAGDHASEFVKGRIIHVAGSTDNDGTYTVVSSVYGTSTVITVTTAPVSTTVDGYLNYSTVVKDYNIGRHISARSKQYKGFFNTLATAFNAGVVITAVSTANKTFTIAGSHLAYFTNGFYGQAIRVSGSTGNDKLYSVVKAVVSGGATVITVNETIADSTADGSIYA